MLGVLIDAEAVSGDVVVKEEVVDSRLDRGRGFGGAVLQPRTIADLGVEALAGYQCFIFLDEREQVERHLIVAAPRNVRERIVNGSRHHVNVFFENGSRVDGERGAGLEARKRLDRVKIEVGKRKVHNLLRFSAKLWTV